MKDLMFLDRFVLTQDTGLIYIFRPVNEPHYAMFFDTIELAESFMDQKTRLVRGYGARPVRIARILGSTLRWLLKELDDAKCDIRMVTFKNNQVKEEKYERGEDRW